MKRVLFLLITLLVLVVMTAGCDLLDEIIVEGSGNIVTQTEAFSDFDKVDLSYAFEAEINQGESYSVVIRIDDNLLDDLEVTKQGDTLKIGFKRNILARNATLEADITMPDLSGVDLSGASVATIVGFKSGDSFDADLSGASELTGDLEAGDVKFDLSGASNMQLTGSGGDMEVDVSGSSDLDLANFAAEDANVKVSGASEATVNVNGTLDANASGASNVYYVGNPTLGDIETSGASSVDSQ